MGSGLLASWVGSCVGAGTEDGALFFEFRFDFTIHVKSFSVKDFVALCM